MTQLKLGEASWAVAPGENLLDALLRAGVALPYSCRAGACHSCLVRCLEGEPSDAQPDALSPAQRAEGWRLACQCRIAGDLRLAPFDPARDGLPACVERLDWPAPGLLRLWLRPERPLRYRPGEHLNLWTPAGVSRPYSLASLPGEPLLEFHLDCRRPGAFIDHARTLQVGDALTLGSLHGGALHYDPEWSDAPLWLLAAGSGLAPLWALLREALRQEHNGPIRLLHIAGEGVGHYLRSELEALAEAHPPLTLDFLTPDQRLPLLRPNRQTRALLCGSPERVDAFAKAMYLAGVPRGQVFADGFVGRG